VPKTVAHARPWRSRRRPSTVEKQNKVHCFARTPAIHTAAKAVLPAHISVAERLAPRHDLLIAIVASEPSRQSSLNRTPASWPTTAHLEGYHSSSGWTLGAWISSKDRKAFSERHGECHEEIYRAGFSFSPFPDHQLRRRIGDTGPGSTRVSDDRNLSFSPRAAPSNLLRQKRLMTALRVRTRPVGRRRTIMSSASILICGACSGWFFDMARPVRCHKRE